MSDDMKKFVQGFACATAVIARFEGCHSTYVDELMGAGGLDWDYCVRHEVDDMDLQVLFPKEYEANKK